MLYRGKLEIFSVSKGDDRVILVRNLNAKIVIYVGIRIIFFISEVKEFDMVNYFKKEQKGHILCQPWCRAALAHTMTCRMMTSKPST